MSKIRKTIYGTLLVLALVLAVIGYFWPGQAIAAIFMLTGLLIPIVFLGTEYFSSDRNPRKNFSEEKPKWIFHRNKEE